MQIIEVPLQDLKEAEYNPRQMTEKQVKDLTESIKRFGLVDPIIANSHKGRENVVVGGHQRLKIASILGFTTIPVVYVNLDEKKERELNLRLNRNLGEWDYNMLANFNEEELLNVGFTSEELDKIFELDVDEKDDEIPEIEESICKEGDLWQLGNHRLLCGDATKKEDVERLMDRKKADMVFTDPPYNIGYDYWDYLDTKETSNYKSWCEKWFNIITSFSPIIILTIGQWNMKMWFDIAKPLGIVNWIARNKTSGSKIALFSIWEPILIYAKKITKKRINKADIIDKDIIIKNEDFLDEVANAKNFVEENSDIIEYNNRVQKNVGVHKCPKQVGMLIELFSRYSEREDIVLDLFGGSGSTLIACEKLNRKCYMMEIDSHYCDVIIKRWEQYTNNKAIKL